MIQGFFHRRWLPLLALAILASASAHAAMTTPPPEKQKQVFDDIVMKRQSMIQEGQRLQELKQKEYAEIEKANMALRGSASQERLEDINPIEKIMEQAPTEQRDYGPAEVGIGAGFLVVVGAMAGYFLSGAIHFQSRKRKAQILRLSSERVKAEELLAANEMLQARVAADEQQRELMAPAALAAMGGVISISSPAAQAAPKWKKLGEVLVEMGVLTTEEVVQSVKLAKVANEKLGRFLVHSGKVSADTLCRAVAQQSGLPMVNLAEVEVPQKLVDKLGFPFMRRHDCVPFKDAKNTVCIASAAPLRSNLISELESQCGKKVEVYLAAEDAIGRLMDNLQRRQQTTLRTFRRYEAKMNVNYQFCNRLGEPINEEEYVGTTLNLSEGGMAIVGIASGLPGARDLMRKGLFMEVIVSQNLDSDDDSNDINAILQVRSMRRKEEGNAESPWIYGLEMTELDDEHRSRLQKLLSTLQPMTDSAIQAAAVMPTRSEAAIEAVEMPQEEPGEAQPAEPELQEASAEDAPTESESTGS